MALVLLAVLPALGIIYLFTSNEKRIHTELVQKDALGLAEATATLLGQEVEGIRQVLLALATLPELSGDDFTACNRLLSNLLPQYPQYDNFGLVRADGVHVASRSSPLTIWPPANIKSADLRRNNPSTSVIRYTRRTAS
jgi:hypothetical protein